MRFYARKYGQDEEKWAVTALLHDFDWEIHPTMEDHPMAGEPILREHGVPDDIIRAVLSHATHSGIPRESLMEKALFACDELTGLITAVALVRPSRALYDLKPKSVKNKWKDRSFAAGANREEIEQGATELGVDLWEHVANVIAAMNTIAEDLDLAGAPQ
jgi:predicted hydrolase (HD superfamily)